MIRNISDDTFKNSLIYEKKHRKLNEENLSVKNQLCLIFFLQKKKKSRFDFLRTRKIDYARFLRIEHKYQYFHFVQRKYVIDDVYITKFISRKHILHNDMYIYVQIVLSLSRKSF